MTHTARITALASAALLGCAMLALGGCARTLLEDRADTGYRPGDLTGELDFWHTLPERPAVSNDEMLHGLILLADGEDVSRDYQDRVVSAVGREWLPEAFDEPAGIAAQRGRLASALVQILDIRGGVMMQVLGPTQRYDLRELIYIGIMPDGTPQQAISGADFLSVITRAQDYRLLKQDEAQRAAAARDADAGAGG